MSGWPRRWAPTTARWMRPPGRPRPRAAGPRRAARPATAATAPAWPTGPSTVTPPGPSGGGHGDRGQPEQVGERGVAAEPGVDADRVGRHLGQRRAATGPWARRARRSPCPPPGQLGPQLGRAGAIAANTSVPAVGLAAGDHGLAPRRSGPRARRRAARAARRCGRRATARRRAGRRPRGTGARSTSTTWCRPRASSSPVGLGAGRDRHGERAGGDRPRRRRDAPTRRPARRRPSGRTSTTQSMRRAGRHDAVGRPGAGRALQPDDAAHRGRHPAGAGGVGAEGERHVAERHRDGRARRRAARDQRRRRTGSRGVP